MIRASGVHTTTLTYWHKEKCPQTWQLRWHAQTRARGSMISPVTTEVCPWVFTDLLCSRTSCSPKGEFLTLLLNFQHPSLPSVWGNENSRGSRVWAGVESQSQCYFPNLIIPTLWGFVRIGGNGSKGPRAGHLVDALSSVPSTIPVGPPPPGFRVLGFYVCTKTPFPRAQVWVAQGAALWNKRSEKFRTRRSEWKQVWLKDGRSWVYRDGPEARVRDLGLETELGIKG